MKKLVVLCLCMLIALSAVGFAAAEEVKLTVMNVIPADNSSQGALFSGWVDEFEAAHPGVKIEHISTVNAELKKQMKIAMLAGTMPDIVTFDNPDYASFAAGGFLMDITDMVADWKEMPAYYDATINAVTYKGRLYGLPFESNSLGLWYNQDLLSELGKEVPVTWDDVLDICVAAKEKGYYGLAMAAPQSEVCTFQFIPWLYAAGGSIEKLDTPEAAKALGFLAELVANGYMSKEVLGYAHGDLLKAFQGGKTVLMTNGSWNIANLANGTPFAYGVTTYPVISEGDVPTNCLGGYHVGITSTCENPEIALEFLKFICSKEENLNWCKVAGLLPTNADTAKDEVFSEEPMKSFVAGLPGAIARVNPFWPDMSANVYTAVQAALAGEKTAEQALADAEALNAAYWQY